MAALNYFMKYYTKNFVSYDLKVGMEVQYDPGLARSL